MILGITEFWGWFEPGVKAFAPAAPLLALALTSVLATAAYFTFRLRTRVDHVDQWWKQVNVAVEKGLTNDDAAKEIADHILETLQSPAELQKPRYLRDDWAWNYGYYEELRSYRKALKKRRKDLRTRWRISDREELLLVRISSTLANRALFVMDDGNEEQMTDNEDNGEGGDSNA